MPDIKITDTTSATITSVSIDNNPLSALTKYVNSNAIDLIFLPNLVNGLDQPLVSASNAPLELGLKFDAPVNLGTNLPSLTISAGASAAVHVAAGPSKNLFPDNLYGAPVSVPATVGYVSLALGATVKAGATASSGSLNFGVEVGGGLGIEFYRAFPMTATAPTVAFALGKVISNYVIPADLADLRQMQPGDIAVVSGQGSLSLSVSANLLAAANPLASVNLPLSNKLSISAGASLDVKAGFQLSGEYQIRVRKLDAGTVELGYYKKAGKQFDFSLTAAAGVSATLGKFDLIQKLIHAVSSDPQADIAALVNGGLSDAEIKTINAAIAGSLNRNLEASLHLAFSAMSSDDAAFLYQIDLAKLDASSTAAVNSALSADLSRLNDMEIAVAADGTIAAGVKLVRSRLTELRKRSLSFKLNLLGILNYSSVSELILKGEVVYEPISGDLTVNGLVSGTRLAILAEPFRADGEKLRKVLFESVMFTTSLRATRTTATAGFTSSQVHFAMNQNSNRATFSDYLDGFVACGLMDIAGKGPILGGITGNCPSTYLLRTEFDDAASEAIFLDATGAAYDSSHYDRIGRTALAALLPADSADDPGGLRRMTLLDDALWQQLQAAGQPTFGTILPFPRNEQPHLGAIVADYTLIEWWAAAMNGAARRLQKFRAFLANANPATLHNDPRFKALLGDLQDHFKDVVSKSKSSFGKPWGLAALYAASAPRVGVTGAIVSSLLTKIEQRDPQVVARAISIKELASVSEAQAARGPALSGQQKEAIRPYTITMRMGALASAGELTTTPQDLDRIFGEELPHYVASTRAAGKKPRLLFYAHGGLVDEVSGLTQVLTSANFWLSNGIYPLYFVWETGLAETVTDIIQSLFGGSREVAPAVPLTNAVLEALARPGGQAVWSNMKRSAQIASLQTGAALEVAERTRAFCELNQDTSLHAVGHSAGSIFHSYFLPALLSQPASAGVPPISVESLHLLAPACTTDLFESNLLELIGSGKGINQLTMYTMHKELELADKAGPYHGSLLYLVSRAFETDQPAAILGIEDSIRKDSALLRFFGLAGFQKPKADLLFSQTTTDASLRSSTTATSHGGFSSDQKTLDSVARRILAVTDDVSIHDFKPGDPQNPFPAKAVSIAGAGQGSVLVMPAGAPAPAVVTASRTRAAKRALCIGINDYPAPNPLQGCVNDARNWSTRLSSLGFEVTRLEDAAATRQGILEALSGMAKPAVEGDVLVLQYSGHGTQVPDINGDESTGLDDALCPIDFAAGQLIIDDDLRDLFDALPLGVNLTSFMDCCHSGTITRMLLGLNPANLALSLQPAINVRKARFIPFSETLSEAHKKFRQRTGLVRAATAVRGRAAMKDILFSACRDNEVAFEVNGVGVFTNKATTVLADGVDAFTNEDFLSKVLTAFGPHPQQNPGIDCGPGNESNGFLRPVSSRALGMAAGR